MGLVRNDEEDDLAVRSRMTIFTGIWLVAAVMATASGVAVHVRDARLAGTSSYQRSTYGNGIYGADVPAASTTTTTTPAPTTTTSPSTTAAPPPPPTTTTTTSMSKVTTTSTIMTTSTTSVVSTPSTGAPTTTTSSTELSPSGQTPVETVTTTTVPVQGAKTATGTTKKHPAGAYVAVVPKAVSVATTSIVDATNTALAVLPPVLRPVAVSLLPLSIVVVFAVRYLRRLAHDRKMTESPLEHDDDVTWE